MSKIPGMLKRIMKEEGATIRGTARAIGVDHSSLIHSLKDTSNPEARTIEKILDYLGYDLKFVKRKGVKQVKPKQSKPKKGGGLSG